MIKCQEKLRRAQVALRSLPHLLILLIFPRTLIRIFMA